MSTLSPPDPLLAFHWVPQPAAQRLVADIVGDFLDRLPAAAELARRMTDLTGTRFGDWIDHIVVPDQPGQASALLDAGFVEKPRPGAMRCFIQEGGIFPAILLDRGRHEMCLRVESIADFAAANDLPAISPEPPLSPYRSLRIAAGEGQPTPLPTPLLRAIERHGYRGFSSPSWSDSRRMAMLHHGEAFRTRRRHMGSDEEGFAHLTHLLDGAIADIGRDVATDLFFAAEREYWQRRNRAAQAQKARQDRLGLGWANHDHHTYRSSRRHFRSLIAVLELLGFHCRERFYAGSEAGWGAQVLEQPTAGIVIFADVDLSPEELRNDFAHEPLTPRDTLGTVGLWCALHGEAILEAGMHHLECQFDFDSLRRQLETEAGIKTMSPFTDFPYLRQAFTEGERWPVREERIAALLEAKLITAEQAAQFHQNGAIGSHLENLERNEGFKGFNQQGVSQIITATDPRTAR